MHGMSPSRPRGCVQANYQQFIPNLQFTHCIMHKLHDWSKKCFGKGYGWICALNRWSVQERAQTSFCPVARQVLHYLAWELCRQIAAYILSRPKPFSLVWGGRGLGGGGILGWRPNKCTWVSGILFLLADLIPSAGPFMASTFWVCQFVRENSLVNRPHVSLWLGKTHVLLAAYVPYAGGLGRRMCS